MWVSFIRGRLLSLRRVASVLHTKTYASREVRCDAHMNELPIPCGPWDVYYKDRQSFYNKILAAGVLWFLISCFLMVYSGSFYLNWLPPENPGPPTELMDECAEES